MECSGVTLDHIISSIKGISFLSVTGVYWGNVKYHWNLLRFIGVGRGTYFSFFIFNFHFIDLHDSAIVSQTSWFVVAVSALAALVGLL